MLTGINYKIVKVKNLMIIEDHLGHQKKIKNEIKSMVKIKITGNRLSESLTQVLKHHTIPATEITQNILT